MEYFKEQGTSYMEAVNKVKTRYGEHAKVLNHRSIRYGGFLGLFSKEGVEVEGYVNHEKPSAAHRNFEEEKNKIIAVAGNKRDDTLVKVLDMVKAIDGKIDAVGTSRTVAEPESVESLEKLMVDNDFTYSYIKKMKQRIKSELTMEQLGDPQFVQQRALVWMGRSMKLYEDPSVRSKRVIVLVGPTGVGKTTSIAKLAAINGLGLNGESAKNVRLITIDNFRIGAKGQIQTYADIMNIPVSCVTTSEELRNKLLLYQDADLVLIDTMGRSPRDYQNLAQMREFLETCGSNSEIFLTLSATTKAGDLQSIMDEFAPFKYSGVILTKLDETMRLGNIISVLGENRMPLAFVTDGQGVPQDIHRADVLRLLKNLEGFRIDPEKLKKELSENIRV